MGILGRPPALEEVWHGTRKAIVVDGDCWIWQGKRFSGYGPYRRLYERYVQPLPTGHDLHHTCRRGPDGCCNPAHLEMLTTAQHRSMHARERGVLSVEDARTIRKLLLDLSLSTAEIGARYGVGAKMIERIGRGKNFADLGGRLTYHQKCPCCLEPFATTERRQRYCCTEHRTLHNARIRYMRRYPNAKPRRGTPQPAWFKILAGWVPSSMPQPWNWDDEERAIFERVCLCCGEVGHHQRKLEVFLAENGLVEGVCLGGDGRVWDGHHRIIASRRLGIDTLPLESLNDSGARWVRDHGYVSWENRTSGDMPANLYRARVAA